MPVKPSGRTWLLLALLALTMGAMALLAARPGAWEGFVAGALASGGLTVLLWRQGDVSMRLVIGAALLFRLAVFWLPPVLSDDAYRYVWDGLVQAEGYNPYLYAPEDPEMAPLHNEPIFRDLNSPAYHTIYPPASQFVFRVGAAFYDRGWEVSYFVIKGILALMEFGAVLVLARMVTPAQLVLYALNPLVVLSGAGQAHGEAALTLFLSLTLLSVRRGQGVGASIWLAFAGWVKLYPFLLFPYLWRRFGWRSAAAGAGTAVILALPYVHPDVLSNVRESLELYVRLFEFNAGPYYAVKELFRLMTGQDWSKQIGPAFAVVFLALLPVLYYLDWKLDWKARRAFALTVGAFFVCSTTVHPWYLLGILVLVAPAGRPAWHWYWLSLLSIGTYLLYVDGPYWIWVILGWLGWLVFGAHRYRHLLVDPILRARAGEKAELLRVTLEEGWALLDIGAGEGYVGRALSRHLDAEVELVDVIDLNRTRIPLRLYDGRHLPFADNRFDAAVLVFVLHHAEDPDAVLREALRVSRRRVVVLESTYEHGWELPLLRRLDQLANDLRSGGKMSKQESSLQFRTHEEWLRTFERLNARVAGEKRLGGFIHHQSLFLLEAPEASDNACA